MATKSEIARTLKRTEELAHEAGLLSHDDALVLFEAEREECIPWSVRLEETRPDGLKRRHSGVLAFLPDSGRSIGTTKREAQETLRTVNGVLVAVLRTRALVAMGY